MSNDDREQPRWGERLPEPSQRPDAGGASGPGADQDQPRYGERVEQTPVSASEPDQPRAPDQQYDGQRYDGRQGDAQQQYGAPQHDAQQQWGQPGQHDNGQQYGSQQNQYGGEQQYGQQNQYGSQQNQYGSQQQHGQPQQHQYGDQQNHHGQQSTQHWNQQAAARTKQRGTLGLVALIAGVIALILGVVGGIVFGNALAGIPGFADAATSGSQDTSQLERSLQDNPSAVGTLLVAVLLGGIGTAFGIWAIIQGIIAAVKGKGRLAGIIAIVLAVLGPIAFGIIYVAVAASSVS